MVIKDILPIGTVVKLKGTDANVMVAGYCSQGIENPLYVWDYSGVLFPIGYSGSHDMISFDSEQIENILSYGYQDEEQISYMQGLHEVMLSIDKNGKGE